MKGSVSQGRARAVGHSWLDLALGMAVSGVALFFPGRDIYRMIPTGIITVSDRASAQLYQDLGGPAVRAAAAALGCQTIAEALVPDELGQIAEVVLSFARQGCQLILTTGGTGIAARDVTPEAIRSVARLEIPGFGESMRMQSLALTPNAVLSRSLGAVVENSLVIALPGKPQGAVDCLHFVAGAIPHTVKILQREPTSC